MDYESTITRAITRALDRDEPVANIAQQFVSQYFEERSALLRRKIIPARPARGGD